MYEAGSRKEAFRQAKRDAGVPMSQRPTEIDQPELRDGNKAIIIGEDGLPIKTRQYKFVNNKGETVFIQEHSLGHAKSSPRHGDAPHFNVRPADPVTGQPLNTKTPANVHGHYNYPKR
ncbi:HNH/endonuclease VII fold putative polymorphic toxin [Salinivibrio kushneri]|uniref:HNH/endonuclease VII fold putative polymorphic toxin n=1 Tax=Salinivibrio kushneri TaxID=1908198 RepID=UPI001F520BEE|nr:HNH/endonuclease VII fold putative polymorphic toxin [Salinivibrio kushneri]